MLHHHATIGDIFEKSVAVKSFLIRNERVCALVSRQEKFLDGLTERAEKLWSVGKQEIRTENTAGIVGQTEL